MTRPLRLEFPGALYHVTARGNRHSQIYRDDRDRRVWLGLLQEVCLRFNCAVYAYCQMTNHYHLLVETIDGELSRGMRHLNGVYSQYVNRRHQLTGQMFQGRYHAVLVQKERHVLELGRYVVLNPVRAGIVAHPEGWQWSSYRCMIGTAPSPSWLDKTWLLEQFGSAHSSPVKAYRNFVRDGLGEDNPLKQARHQTILGDSSFLLPDQVGVNPAAISQVSRIQRRAAALTLPEYALMHASRDHAMMEAYRSTVFSMADIAKHFGVSVKTVSRAVAKLPGTEDRQAAAVTHM